MQGGGNLKKYILLFENILKGIMVEDISPVIYCKKYLHHLLDHKKYYLAIYADVIEKLLLQGDQKKEDFILLDCGAGNGLLGIFAKFCGFKKVYLNDIDPAFMAASQKLSMHLKIPIDGFITGDIGAVQEYFKSEIPTAIVGTDVIEHIYNLEYFFDKLHQINPSMITVFTTASNPKNIYKIWQIKKWQTRDELKGGTPGDHILFGETAHEPFFKIRERIIRLQFDAIEDKFVYQMAKVTRGMNKADIITAVNHYKLTGFMPAPPLHPTNTCDPISGSWTERILKLEQYDLIYRKNGFKLNVYNGFYNEYKKGLKYYISRFLNKCILIFGVYPAPYIILTGSGK